jgi:phage protein D
VGRRVSLEGVGPLFSGNYLVTESHHLFDYQGGYRTAFEVERPGLGNPQ